MLIFLIEAVLLAAIAILGGIKPLKLRPAYKLLLCVPVCLIAFKFQLFFLFGGAAFFSPDVPGWLLAVSGLLFMWLILFDLALLLWNIFRWIPLLFFKLTKKTPPVFLTKEFTLPLLVISAIPAFIGLYCGTADPGVHEITMEIKGLAPEAEGFRIAMIADLHADRLTSTKRIQTITDRINALSPDVVVLVGDLADGTPEERKDDLAPLKGLRSRFGTFAVPGNHEYYCGYAVWRKYYPELGMTLLENRSQALPGTGVVIAGVTDPQALRFEFDTPDVEQALDQTDPGKNTVVLLSHRPKKKIAEEAESRGVALQLSGHTHGGMMAGLDRIIAASNDGLVCGEYRIGKMWLYVSPGTGIWNGFPIRLGVPSEITLIRLTGTSH